MPINNSNLSSSRSELKSPPHQVLFLEKISTVGSHYRKLCHFCSGSHFYSVFSAALLSMAYLCVIFVCVYIHTQASESPKACVLCSLSSTACCESQHTLIIHYYDSLHLYCAKPSVISKQSLQRLGSFKTPLYKEAGL